ENKKIPVAQQKAMMHSSTKEIVALAQENKPGLLVTYHEQNFTNNPNQMEDEIRQFGWKGEYVSSRDGDIF
ncbi:MAG: hypothetical protein O7F73_05325, partial [Gammaproteobacteria bacterium]|nr:hypothetical protein [Gammaproteobacteria bacterium]